MVHAAAALFVLALAAPAASQSTAATRRTLPAAATAAGAVALDGSPYVYYVAPGAETRKYVVYQRGGGWCSTDVECAERSFTELGSSNATFFPPSVDYATFAGTFKLLLANETSNPLAWNWTRIYLPYLDGASQTGDLDAPVPVPFRGATRTVYYRGKRIHDATVAALLANEGLASATDVLYGGGSAGALAVYLHADVRARARSLSRAPAPPSPSPSPTPSPARRTGPRPCRAPSLWPCPTAAFSWRTMRRRARALTRASGGDSRA
jgi:hypothetical protein